MKKYDLILVETSFEAKRVEIYRVNVINGDCLTPVTVGEGKTIVAQMLELIEVIKRDKPDKVIFNKMGMGQVVYDTFMFMVKHDENIAVDSFGTIYFKGEWLHG